jgi:hypothetical protein
MAAAHTASVGFTRRCNPSDRAAQARCRVAAVGAHRHSTRHTSHVTRHNPIGGHLVTRLPLPS